MATVQLKIVDNLSILKSISDTWTRDEELVQTVKLGSSDGAYSIDFTSITNIKVIVVSGESPYTLTLTKNSIDSVLTSESLFVLVPSEVDRALLESISITATDATVSNYDILIFGEE